MQKIIRSGAVLASVVLFSVMLAGCSSSPDEAQMKQLSDLRAEVSSLEKEVADKEQRVSNLNKEVAEKNAKLRKCNDDQQVVKQRLGQ